MLKHVVMWRLKENALGQTKKENAEKMIKLIKALEGKIEGVISLEAGINALPDPQAYDVVLVGTYEDEAAFGRYLEHPDHVVAANFIGEVRESRTVVDYFTS